MSHLNATFHALYGAKARLLVCKRLIVSNFLLSLNIRAYSTLSVSYVMYAISIELIKGVYASEDDAAKKNHAQTKGHEKIGTYEEA